MLTNALQRPSRIFQPLAVLLTMIFSLGVPFWVIIVTAGKSAVEARQPNLALPSNWEFGKNISSTFSEGNMEIGRAHV